MPRSILSVAVAAGIVAVAACDPPRDGRPQEPTASPSVASSAVSSTSAVAAAPSASAAPQPPEVEPASVKKPGRTLRDPSVSIPVDPPKPTVAADPTKHISLGPNHWVDTDGLEHFDNFDYEKEPIDGKTIDFEYDGADVHNRTLAYTGRLFVPTEGVGSKTPLAMLTFIHGFNFKLVPHRWLGGGQEGDARRILSEMVKRGLIPPMIVGGPGSVQPEAVCGGSSFPIFDFDNYVKLSKKALAGVAEIDDTHLIVVGHSGAGCTDTGGIAAPGFSKVYPPEAIISIDTCMNTLLARGLAAANPDVNVIVVYQRNAWVREFDDFIRIFKREVAQHPATPGVMRTLDEFGSISHNNMVPLTMLKYLPFFIGPGTPPTSPPNAIDMMPRATP
ncbi:MAG: hypothetical protein U0414_08315 [Polyangiaceae bacterium]